MLVSATLDVHQTGSHVGKKYLEPSLSDLDTRRDRARDDVDSKLIFTVGQPRQPTTQRTVHTSIHTCPGAQARFLLESGCFPPSSDNQVPPNTNVSVYVIMHHMLPCAVLTLHSIDLYAACHSENK
ncbi:hypothetical protein SeMB42_g00621 [Synchytrium endobioticum]|uniref:Uncharacterized protein n=1 Tax=Synchytrium endobioticum TaxID=286115 RepID=A0A507DQN0_9FUNG|nr:hypothetical protein SeMB42_g00621 [Synchytrium endobioticum]